MTPESRLRCNGKFFGWHWQAAVKISGVTGLKHKPAVLSISSRGGEGPQRAQT